MIDRRAPFSKVSIRRLEYMSKVDSPTVTGWDSVIPLAMREDPRVALAHLRIVLPSDAQWRDTNYQRLVDIQRALNAAASSSSHSSSAASTTGNRKPLVSPEPMADAVGATEKDDREAGEKGGDDEEDEQEEEEKEEEEEEPSKRPRSTAVFTQQTETSASSSISCDDDGRVGRGGVFWSNADLMMAARLVSNYSAPEEATEHAQNAEKQPHKPPVSLLKDPEQMRRVYTLIYDVLRYKPVLTEALNHLNFMTEHPQLQDDMLLLICLFFYNLYRKDFRYQEPIISDQEQQKEEAPIFRRMKEVNDLLWQYRVRLGAIISRMRIAREAYDLEQLLPQHLINARSKVNDRIVCGWINYFKAKPRDVFAELDAFGLSHLPEGSGDQLRPLTYKLDHILPRFLHAMPKSRQQFTCSSLFVDNKVIMQECTFCLGPASVAQLLVDLALTGVVAQTHVSSLVTVAYLANLLATNEKVDGLIVFGAGSRKELCEEYLCALGVTNTTVHAVSFSELSADSELLANVVTVLATPPNTNSHVVDAVDLSVARGGDLHLLHQLTQETFHTSSQGQTQVMHTMLTEQRDTLRMSMSKPQIQFVVYETHSRYDLENSEMVVRVITEMNGYATEKHLEEQRKRRYGGGGAQGDPLAGNPPEGGSSVDFGQPPAKMAATEEDSNQLLKEPPMFPPEEITINVPACDLFELSPLPDLCPHRDECLKLEEEGTYIAVIKRKEITRLDPKYMIEMAESRGLFGAKGGSGDGGAGSGGGRRGALSREQRRKAAAQRMQRSRSGGSDSERNHKSKVKVELDRIAAPTHASMGRDVRFKESPTECARHKLHLTHKPGHGSSGSRARLWWRQLSEFLLDLIRDPDINLDSDPDLPRLRLTRPKYRPIMTRKPASKPRSPFPMHVNYIEFQSSDDDNDDDSDDDDILQLCPCLASVLTSAPDSLFTAVT